MVPDDFEKARSTYYQMMGWDGVTGISLQTKLDELGISWAGSHLPSKGKEP
jgi:aldehyde:ferredoxin oxidoreductase